jgi:hypothetical protein
MIVALAALLNADGAKVFSGEPHIAGILSGQFASSYQIGGK